MTCPVRRVKAFVGWAPGGTLHVVMVPWDIIPCECGLSATATHEHAAVDKHQWLDAWHQCERNLVGTRRVDWEEDPRSLFDAVARRRTSRVVRGVVLH